DPLADFAAINAELAAYAPALAGKPQLVAINKVDLPETQTNLPRLTAALSGEGYQVFPISAATGEGVPLLLHRTMELLQELPLPVEEAPQKRRVYTLEEEDEERWEAVRRSAHHYDVTGPKIERLTRMTDFANEEAAARFQRVLEASGISRALEEQGIQPGDIVHIADLELTWDQEALDAEAREAAHERRRKTRRQRIAARLGQTVEDEELGQEG
ncbi:MAG TPA: Obg family GTPase CgtA, partial [Trueperaceae bacterium]